MCWCARVYWTVLQNLFARFYNSLAERNCGACCRQRCYCCCGGYRRQASDVDADSDSIKRVSASNANEDQQQRPQHDYVIVGEFWTLNNTIWYWCKYVYYVCISRLVKLNWTIRFNINNKWIYDEWYEMQNNKMCSRLFHGKFLTTRTGT